MPATDGLGASLPSFIMLSEMLLMKAMMQYSFQQRLAPRLTRTESAIVRDYGGWTRFLQSFELNPWDESDIKEGKRIVKELAEDQETEATGGGR